MPDHVSPRAEISRPRPRDLTALAGPLAALYRDSFAEPPWRDRACGPDEALRQVRTALDHSGLVMVTSWTDGVLAGAAYGWPSPGGPGTGTAFFTAALGAVPVAQREYLLAPSLTVAELMVGPRFRRGGLGRALLTELTRGQRTAWLCTHPRAPAARMYERAGWLTLGEFTSPSGGPRLIFAWAAAPAAP
jgi:GNAT superfamily N-acetyltransferase